MMQGGGGYAVGGMHGGGGMGMGTAGGMMAGGGGGVIHNGVIHGGYSPVDGDIAGGGGAACQFLGCGAVSKNHASEVMDYVGTGGGEYIRETTYRYVGSGGGEFDVFQSQTEPQRPDRRGQIMFAGGVFALALLVVLFFTVPLPTTTVLKSAGGGLLRSSAPSTYDCSDGFQQWQASWADDKKEFCCRTLDMGCEPSSEQLPMQPSAALQPRPEEQLTFDCEAGYDSWDVGWTPAKKAWCCDNRDRGCTTAAIMPASVAQYGKGSCLIWGDPHFETFDGARTDFLGEGEVWVVKSDTVQVQARYLATPYTNGLAATHDIAISGLFIRNHILKVGPMLGGKITWDSDVILQSFGDFPLPSLGKITYSSEGELVDSAQEPLTKNVVHVTMPDGFEMQIFRWENHLNVRITMSPAPNQDGHCGNYNGDRGDDTHDAVVARIGDEVQKVDLIFNGYTQRTHGTAPTMDDCPAKTREEAKASCRSQQADEALFQGCVFDVCFAGERYAVQDRASAAA
mmetsp:Transcript_164833/g.528921  ORF Transcript_164833/g.528921 Transcript_164833/m.528921 type:complete len:512 (-) Transcript_164833:130-1665(-)